MSERLRHLGGHLRRHGIAYAALTVAFSFSPMPSMAADLVTTGEIANSAVTQPKLAADSVVSGKILNESVNGVDIKNGSVGSADLADGAVTGVDVLNASLTSADVLDGTIGTNDVANGSIGGADVADGSITHFDLAANTISGAEILNESIDGRDLNLFRDGQCTGETVQGTALVNADPNVPQNYTLDWIGYDHTCSGGPVRVARAAAGQYYLHFGEGNPSRLAQATLVGGNGSIPRAFISVEYVPHLSAWLVLIRNRDGVGVDDDFSVLLY